MKQRILCVLGVIIILGWAMITGGPANAATAAGPYYANPSWDQQLQCDSTDTCPRFIVLSNWVPAKCISKHCGAVLDRETGLVWEQSPSTDRFNWSDAQFHCNDLTLGNRRGWRVPTAQELASLEDPSVPSPGPTLPSGHPFSSVQNFYWAGTTVASDTTDATAAWMVDFSSGHVTGDRKVGEVFVWCVRGGVGVDPR